MKFWGLKFDKLADFKNSIKDLLTFNCLCLIHCFSKSDMESASRINEKVVFRLELELELELELIGHWTIPGAYPPLGDDPNTNEILNNNKEISKFIILILRLIKKESQKLKRKEYNII